MRVTEVPPHVVEGARRAIAEHGLAGATLERIAAAAGVSRMTLHRHGLSKEQILASLAEQLLSVEREAVWRALVADGTARDRLREALERHCDVAEANLDVLEALSAEIYHERDAPERTRRIVVEPIERLLRDGAIDGSLAPQDDVEETATVLINQVGRTYRHLRTGHGWGAERARAAVLRLALNGVAAR